MGFVKSYEEMAKAYRETGEFYDAEMLAVAWETKPEIVERLLPPPLKPSRMPLVLAFIANYPKTNFGVTYLEAALFLMAEFNGEPHVLPRAVTNDTAMAAGVRSTAIEEVASIELNREDRTSRAGPVARDTLPRCTRS
jgi:acetoacetate decarboxylase